MADAGTLISNQGNAGLGTGGNPDIPVGYGKDLDVINDISKTLTLVNLDQNRRIFEQKIRDRDRMLAAVDSGDLKIGDILEEDQPVVKEGLDNLDAVWEEWAKNPNNIESQVKYKKALRDAQDRVTQANARFLGDRSQNLEIAKDTLPRIRDARAKNLQSWKKNFWGEVMPYQQQQDLDIPGSILSTAATTTTEFTDPKTFTKGKQTLFDYEKTYDANLNNYLNDVNKAYDQRQLVNALQALDPKEFTEKIEAINNRIKEYNTMKGLVEGSDGFVYEVKVEYDPQTGRGIINERLPDFSAKFTLANQKPFGAVSSEFDKDRASFALGQERNKIAAANAAANQMRARAYSALQNKKLSQMTDDEKRTKNFWDGITSKVKEYKIESKKGAGLKFGDYVFAGDLPKGYQYIGGIGADGKPIRLIPKKGEGGTEYYDTKYYDIDGGEIDLVSQYKEYVDNGGRESYENLRKKLLRSGKINLELIGQNGVGNFETAFQTARSLSNKATTKGEEPIFGEQEEVIQIEE